MIKTIVAVDRDGLDVRITVLNFEVPTPDFDLRAAVSAAVKEFCATDAGKAVYKHNCRSFNWGDFDLHVSSEFCEAHGFRKLVSSLPDNAVDFNEELISEEAVFPDDQKG